MKTILLIGKLSEIVRSLNECLADDFQVQICPDELTNVKAMVKITKPQLIIISQIGMEEANTDIFEWIHQRCFWIPVLGIATSDQWEQCREFYQGEKVDVLCRPLKKSELVKKCRELLGEEQGDAKPHLQKKPELQLKKIMIVDDSAVLLRSMKNMLEKHYDICLAKSGEQALKIIPRENPDLVLLDYEMEGMDGRETFEVMKADEAMKSIPVVFLTSVSDKQAVYSVLKSNPDGYILKPPDEDKIREKIREILGGQ